MDTVFFPDNSDIDSVFNFCNQMEVHTDCEQLTIDFSKMGRVEPFTMLYIAKRLREIFKKNKNIQYAGKGFENKSYVAHMGFFRACGLDYGKNPGEAYGSPNYIPFTILRVQTVADEAAAEKSWIVEQDIVEKRAEKIAQILCRRKSGKLVDTLTYSIREIMRNIVEHSESKQIVYCAQHWPAYNKVEIAMLDSGVGLMTSLSQNPHVQIENDSDAIQQSLMPAISSKNYKGAYINTDDPWHNSGFGLYMTSRICRLGGSFLICSGSQGILLWKGGKEHIELGHYFQGTVVRMILNTQQLGKLDDMLSDFRKDGVRIAKDIKGTGIYRASDASQMLSRDFKKAEES